MEPDRAVSYFPNTQKRWSRPSITSSTRGARRHLRTGKKRGPAVGKTKRGKGTKIMAVADASGLPVAAHVESASPHEVKLVEATIERLFAWLQNFRRIVVRYEYYAENFLGMV